MNLLRRIVNLIRGLINRVLSRVENVEDQLTVALADMTSQYEVSQKAVTRAMVDEKKIQMTWESEEQKGREWERRAVLAVQEGKDELAKQALLKQKEHLMLMIQVKQNWQRQQEQTYKLKESLKVLREKIDRARREYHLLVARLKSAEAQKTFSQTLGVSGNVGAIEQFKQLSEKVDQLEIEAQAEAEVLGVGSIDADIEAQFTKMEDHWTGEAALSALKAKMKGNLLLDPPVTPSSS